MQTNFPGSEFSDPNPGQSGKEPLPSAKAVKKAALDPAKAPTVPGRQRADRFLHKNHTLVPDEFWLNSEHSDFFFWRPDSRFRGKSTTHIVNHVNSFLKTHFCDLEGLHKARLLFEQVRDPASPTSKLINDESVRIDMCHLLAGIHNRTLENLKKADPVLHQDVRPLTRKDVKSTEVLPEKGPSMCYVLEKDDQGRALVTKKGEFLFRKVQVPSHLEMLNHSHQHAKKHSKDSHLRAAALIGFMLGLEMRKALGHSVYQDGLSESQVRLASIAMHLEKGLGEGIASEQKRGAPAEASSRKDQGEIRRDEAVHMDEGVSPSNSGEGSAPAGPTGQKDGGSHQTTAQNLPPKAKSKDKTNGNRGLA